MESGEYIIILIDFYLPLVLFLNFFHSQIVYKIKQSILAPSESSRPPSKTQELQYLYCFDSSGSLKSFALSTSTVRLQS